MVKGSLSDHQIRQIQRVAGHSAYYVKDLKTQWPSTVKDDWRMATRFWFDHAFYQGRSDKLSFKFEMKALQVLDEALGVPYDPGGLSGIDLEADGALETALKSGGLPKLGDRRLVSGTLALIRELPDKNLVGWSVDAVQEGNIDMVFRRLDDVPSVGDKIVTFFLRDLDFLFDFHLDAADLILLQPIDTWVRKISARIGFVDEQDAEYWVKRGVVKACLAADAKPGLYNVGAWWVGSRGLQLPGEETDRSNPHPDPPAHREGIGARSHPT
jgi:hypothetical protein